MQDGTSPTVDSRTPRFNVSCQTCRISKTFLTMQGVNSFDTEHEGHQVIEGSLFERPQIAKRPEVVAEETLKPQVEETPEVVAVPVDVILQETKPRENEAPEVAAPPLEVAAQEVEPQTEEAPEVVVGSADVTAQELKPQVEEVPEVVATPVEVATREVEPQVEERADAVVREEAPAPLPQATQPAETQVKEPIAAAPSLLSEKDLKEPLLLARSSYIGESDEKRIDALRVSRALKEFRWNVEPPYVIGVMVDDNLSVETNIGVISSAMVERVEKLGYKFVAMNAPQGSPIAWFKREAQEAFETNSPVGDAERMMHIRQGTRTYDKDKAVWQESFVSLLMTVKDMDGQKLKRVTNIIKSERPEPDLQ